MFKSIGAFLARHKFLTVLALAALVGGGYYVIRSQGGTKGETRYVLGSVTKDTIITSVTGSGQVNASEQVDLKPKVSGNLSTFTLKAGQEVKSGQLLVSIDATDALKNVRDAQDNVTSAQLSLDKLKQAADSLTLLQAQNALFSAQDAQLKAQTDMTKDASDAVNDYADAWRKLPNVMAGLEDVLYSNTLDGSRDNIDTYDAFARRIDETTVDRLRADASAKFSKAKASYDGAYASSKTFSATAPQDQLLVSLDEAAAASQDLSDAVSAGEALVRFYVDRAPTHDLDVSPVMTDHLSSLSSYGSTVDAQVTTLKAAARTIRDDQDALTSAARTITERQASLDKVNEPPDELDLRTAELTLRTRQGALDDARSKLADYSVRAPFDGVLASVGSLQRGDAVSSGTTLATIITKEPVAKIDLNEVDVAKVKVGQKATLTFDALPDLSIVGDVANVDTLGTTTQGVVSYGVTIAFATGDDRVKPGMTVSAAIITEAKTDVLTVPNGAIKSSNGAAYVETIAGASAADADVPTGILAPQGLKRITVEAGLASDTLTEITSGLKEGDLIVVRTITTTTAPSGTGNRSILQAASASGARTGAGGNTGFRTGGGGSVQTFRVGN